ncbi:MAG: hypothetical protein IT435_04535 [Phycisphaerales bacterium]|nr:hypothetical protein [Phycisphaerales bacterium]
MAINADGTLSGDGREGADAPWAHTDVPGAVAGFLAWHHMIPWNCLRDTWKKLRSPTTGQGNALAALDPNWDVLYWYMYLLAVPDPADKIKKMKKSQLTTGDQDVIFTKLVWNGWNIVEGPAGQFRTDDPAEDYDLFRVGLSSHERQRAVETQLLFDAMVSYVPPSESRVLQGAIDRTRRYRGGDPIMLKKEMWTPEGFTFKKGATAATLHTRWTKAMA